MVAGQWGRSLERRKMREGHFDFCRNAPGVAGTCRWSCGIYSNLQNGHRLLQNRVGSLSDQKAHLGVGKNNANSPKRRPVPIQSFTNAPYANGDWGLWQTFPPNVEISNPAWSHCSIYGGDGSPWNPKPSGDGSRSALGDLELQPGNRVAGKLVLEVASRGLEFHLLSNYGMRLGKGVHHLRTRARDLKSAAAGARHPASSKLPARSPSLRRLTTASMTHDFELVDGVPWGEGSFPTDACPNGTTTARRIS